MKTELILESIFVFLVICIIFVIYLLINKQSSKVIERYNNNICANYLDPKASISCYDYLKVCEPNYYNEVVDENFEIGEGKRKAREWILKDLRLAIDGNGRNLRACKIDYPRFKRYGIDEDTRNYHKWGNCPEGASWQGWPNGCVFEFYQGEKDERKPTQRCEHKWVWDYIRIGRIKIRAYVRKKICEPALWRLLDIGDENKNKSFREGLGVDVGHWNPNFIHSDLVPKNRDIVEKNNQTLMQNYNEFSNSKVRSGYINGIIYYPGIETGTWGQMPLIQKKFRLENDNYAFVETEKKRKRMENRFFTLVFRYSAKKYKEISESMSNINVSRWFSRNELGMIGYSGDPYLEENSIVKFLSKDSWDYRNRYVLDLVMNTYANYTFIVEVCNRKDKDSPVNVLLCMEFKKHVEDGNSPESLERFFKRYRIVDSENTTNKRIISDQNDFEFRIDAGNQNAWVIYNRFNPAIVHMSIITNRSIYDGSIFVSNGCINDGQALNLHEPIQDFEKFKENHIGQWMNVWVCADLGDPFQSIPMVKREIINHHEYSLFFMRPKKNGKPVNDITWAAKLWASFTQDSENEELTEASKSQDEVKQLALFLKDKEKINFEIYKWICDTAAKIPIFKKRARKMQCYYKDSGKMEELICSN